MVRKETRDVWVTTSGDEYESEVEAERAQSIVDLREIMFSIDKDWNRCTVVEAIDALAVLGYTIVKK